MFFTTSYVLLITFFILQNSEARDSVELTDNNSSISKREIGTRYLIFPQGSNVQLVYCMTIAALAQPRGFFTFGTTAGLAYELPHRDTVPYRKPAEVYHRRSRRDLYRKVELMLRTQGKDGKACVLKAICKAAQRDPNHIGKGTFLEEIFHSIFTLPGGAHDVDPMTEYEKAYWSRENCDSAYASCPDVF
ncbi:uncharacterized protein [Prorops nasuta]|uniref:uncharacterized protein n=1 Tax=Prorops nasuta TaxID=863751 RepID=UPI0034CE30A1